MNAGQASVSPIQAAADENLLTAFGLLVPHSTSEAAGTATFGGAVAIVTGADLPFFNPIIIVDAAVTPGDVRSAVDWVRGRGIEPCLQVRADLELGIAAVAAELGLAPDPWRLPGMALDPIPDSIPAPPTELELRLVRTNDDLEAWYAAAGEVMRALIPPTFALDARVRWVVGSVDGRPLCVSIVVDAPRAFGIYSVGTRKDARGRGYGRAVTWAAIDAARNAWGRKPVVLQSSEMGDAVYRAMGFVEICRYAVYAPLEPV